MHKTFFVFRKKNKKVPIISSHRIPVIEKKIKRAFVGGKAKRETLFRLYGYYPLSLDSTKVEINKFIEKNLYRTSRWSEYLSTLKIVENEVKSVEEENIFQYTLHVEYDSSTKATDEDLIFFIMNELNGTPMDHLNNIKNPIISLTKKFQ